VNPLISSKHQIPPFALAAHHIQMLKQFPILKETDQIEQHEKKQDECMFWSGNELSPFVLLQR
jgi:hypothetical protein